MFLNVKKRANQAGSTMGLAASSSAIQSLTMVSDDETKLARFGDRVSSSPKTSPKSVKQKEIEDALNSSNDQMSPLLNLLKGMAGGTGQDTRVFDNENVGILHILRFLQFSKPWFHNSQNRSYNR